MGSVFAVAVLLLAQPAPDFNEVARQAEAARRAERLAEAVRLYREGVKLRPQWAEGWWYLGSILYDQDRCAEAREPLERYLRLDERSAQGYALLGLCTFQARGYSAALGLLQQARKLGLDASPQMGAVVDYHRVQALTKLERYEEALHVLLPYAAQGQDNAALMEAAGIAGLRRPLLAAELPARDRDLALLAGRAVWHVLAKQGLEAEKDFAALLGRYPKTSEVHFLYGMYLVTIRPEEALAELLRELEISPHHVPCLVQVALEYSKRGEAETGLPYAQRAVKLSPRDFVARYALGRLLVDTGKVQEGIKELETAKAIAPDSPPTRFALGSAYRLAGRMEEATRELAEFERLKKLVDQAKPQ